MIDFVCVASSRDSFDFTARVSVSPTAKKKVSRNPQNRPAAIAREKEQKSERIVTSCSPSVKRFFYKIIAERPIKLSSHSVK